MHSNGEIFYIDQLILSPYTLFLVEEPQIPKNVQKVDTLLTTDQSQWSWLLPSLWPWRWSSQMISEWWEPQSQGYPVTPGRARNAHRRPSESRIRPEEKDGIRPDWHCLSLTYNVDIAVEITFLEEFVLPLLGISFQCWFEKERSDHTADNWKVWHFTMVRPHHTLPDLSEWPEQKPDRSHHRF